MPFAELVVPAAQAKAYRRAVGGKVKVSTCPDRIKGFSMVRNWVRENFRQRIVVMCDDDITKLWNMTRAKGSGITDPDTIEQLIDNTAICALDAGAKIFGFNQAWDVRKVKLNQPFVLRDWVGGVIGVIGDVKWDANNRLRVDIDCCLKSLQRDRIVWRDNRYSFVQERFSNSGGNSIYRTKDADEKEIAYLKQKWGKHLRVKRTKYGITLALTVKRNQ